MLNKRTEILSKLRHRNICYDTEDWLKLAKKKSLDEDRSRASMKLRTDYMREIRAIPDRAENQTVTLYIKI